METENTGNTEENQDSGNLDNNQNDSGNQADDNQGNEENNDSGSQDFNSLPDWAQKQIKDLRSESAKHRTANRGLEDRFSQLETGMKSALGLGEDDKLSPEEQVNGLKGENEDLAVQNAILGLALENGISGDGLEYFSFLMEKQLGTLEDGQELSEEDFASIVGKSKGSKGQSNDSSVNEQGNRNKDPNAGTGVTLESFVNMGMMEKSKLYAEKPEVYKALFAQAKEKNLIK